jgi:hypothetical protein
LLEIGYQIELTCRKNLTPPKTFQLIVKQKNQSMKFRKTIKIFLIDGDPNGRMSCELSNWSGKAYKIPRIKVKDCSDRNDLTSTGVYLLFGKNHDGKDQVYIGEMEI